MEAVHDALQILATDEEGTRCALAEAKRLARASHPRGGLAVRQFFARSCSSLPQADNLGRLLSTAPSSTPACSRTPTILPVISFAAAARRREWTSSTSTCSRSISVSRDPQRRDGC